MTTSVQVLVHLDPNRAAMHRLAVARELAQRLGGSLTALYAVTPAFVEIPYAPELGPILVPELVELDEQRRTQAFKLFQEAMNAPGAPAHWSQICEAPITGAFVQQALYADLLILGQHDPNPADPASTVLPPDFVESVLVASGRPALVIPYVPLSRPLAETIVIAWKETREAARAVSAAVPLLQMAKRVHVIAWIDGTEPRVGGAQLNLDTYLRGYGVEPTWHHGGAEPTGIGDMLLSRAFDLGADLLVMGCYGHSRARELVMGGASRTILQSMTMPVLMAH